MSDSPPRSASPAGKNPPQPETSSTQPRAVVHLDAAQQTDTPEQSLPSPTPTAGPSFPPPHTESSSAAETSNHLQQDRPSGLDPELGSEIQQPRPDFQPFFTLIDDASTQTTHHPSNIHYIFSDDDSSDLLCAASIQSLHHAAGSHVSPQSSSSSIRHPQAQPHSPSSHQVMSSSTSSSSSAVYRKKEQQQDTKNHNRREERVIIVDVNASGDSITRVSSLSSNWQVLGAEILNAPTFDRWPADTVGETGEQGLMLKIEGIGKQALAASGGGPPSTRDQQHQTHQAKDNKGLGISTKQGNQQQSDAPPPADYWDEEWPSLLDSFDKNMGMLRKIMEAGIGAGVDVSVNQTLMPPPPPSGPLASAIVVSQSIKMNQEEVDDYDGIGAG